MKKTYQKKQTEAWKQTVFSNTFDAPFNPNKLIKFYAVIKQGDKSFVTEYAAKQRSEAVAIFNEEARLFGGQVEVIGVFK
jgi:flavodoxin